MMTGQVVIPARQVRAGVINGAQRTQDGGGDDDRRVLLTFSSEEPVLRFFGWEVLGHGPGEVDLSLLTSGRAPLLTDHTQAIDSQVGVVDEVWIENGEGKAWVRFGRHPRADEILARVRDGEITGVSVGYQMLPASAVVGEREGDPLIRAHWRPFEITLCPVPADPTVGIGRSAADGEPEITISLERNMKGSEMTKENNTPAPATPAPAAAPAEGSRAAAPAAPAAPQFDRDADRTRQREIRALGRKFSVPDEQIDAAVDGDTTVSAFQRSILDDMESPTATATRGRAADIGLTDKEVSSFSILRAMRFLADPTNNRAKEAAAFEIEVSEAAQSTLKREAKGILVPNDVLASQAFARAQNVGSAAAGGVLVDTQYMSGSFIDLLRKRSALSRLGVRMLSGLSGNVAIPRQNGGGTAYWVGEGGAPTESELAFGNLSLTPHTLAAAVPVTRRAMIQTTPDMEALVRSDLIKIMALEMDAVGINGSASPDAPDGLLDATGINTVDFATAGQPTWAEILEMESEIGADDADVEGMKYLFNNNMRGHLKGTVKAEGTAEFIMKGKEVNGYEAVVSNNSPGASAILGNWDDYIQAMWSGLDLTVDAATLAASGGVHLRAFQDVDFGVRHVESFCHGRAI